LFCLLIHKRNPFLGLIVRIIGFGVDFLGIHSKSIDLCAYNSAGFILAQLTSSLGVIIRDRFFLLVGVVLLIGFLEISFHSLIHYLVKLALGLVKLLNLHGFLLRETD